MHSRWLRKQSCRVKSVHSHYLHQNKALYSSLADGKRHNIFATLTWDPIIQNTVQQLQDLGHNVTLDNAIRFNDSSQSKQAFLHKYKNTMDTFDGLLISDQDLIGNTDIISLMPNLRCISLLSSGFQNIDINYCNKNKIHVFNISDAQSECMADFTIGLLISTARIFQTNTNNIKKCGVNYKWLPLQGCGQEISSSTVGIFGFGKIAIELSKKLYYGFNCNILYHSRTKKDDNVTKEFNAKYVTFDQLLQESDFVIALSSLNKDTQYIFNQDAFKKMKPNACFINACRGKVCDTNALVEALNNNWIFAAGVDVTDPEPLPSDHPLWNCKNAVILPHIGSATFQMRQKMLDIARDNLLCGLYNRDSPNYLTSWHMSAQEQI